MDQNRDKRLRIATRFLPQTDSQWANLIAIPSGNYPTTSPINRNLSVSQTRWTPLALDLIQISEGILMEKTKVKTVKFHLGALWWCTMCLFACKLRAGLVTPKCATDSSTLNLWIPKWPKVRYKLESTTIWELSCKVRAVRLSSTQKLTVNWEIGTQKCKRKEKDLGQCVWCTIRERVADLSSF